MSGVNKAIIIGHAGSAPKLQDVGSSRVASFSVATNERWTDKSGKRQDRTDWHRIKAWGKLADICDRHLYKGQQVYVEGKMRLEEWTTQDGAKRSVTTIVASTITFLTWPNSDQPRADPARAPSASSPSYVHVPANYGGSEDDIPF